MKSRQESQELLKEYIKSPALINHCEMVASAMEAYAKDLGKSSEEIDKWWTTGLLHDLDWEMYPDEHPNKAINEILPEIGYEEEILDAIAAHAPERTGKQPETEIERYLFACDEISGFMNAASLVRPEGFIGMKPKSITKKLKDSHFAAAVSREDINDGAKMIGKELGEHIAFLIEVFAK
ncbi:HDIG domain-containing protein [Candidatus Dojkabacteria bacterium]|uniref:HDIG domain-containing protein n=1 Tax=Candidatus Dojkabacteria bacterium TaxID=2099670 RepID=A0A955LAD3_9BACT|nr:HDIG domain-containing protein [Candidatus Dojkabacteria bacterium]